MNTIHKNQFITIQQAGRTLFLSFDKRFLTSFKETFSGSKLTWNRAINMWEISSQNKSKVLAWAETLVEVKIKQENRVKRVFASHEEFLLFRDARNGKNYGATWEDDEGNICVYDYSGEDYQAPVAVVEVIAEVATVEVVEANEVSIIDIIESKKALVADAVTERDAKQAQKEAEEAKVKEFLESLLDIHAINGAMNEMKRWHKQIGSDAMEKFKKARKVFQEAEAVLAKMNLGSRGIDFLAEANFNRPDRDSVYKAPSIYELYEINNDQ